jgi:uncharacterized protein YciI
MIFRRILFLLTLSASAALPVEPPDEMYYLVFLKPDPARPKLPDDEAKRIQAAHMANIQKMAKEGTLVAAGPFEDEPRTISGVFVIKAGNTEAATRIASEDPTVKAHRNTVEVHGWRAPAGIGAEYMKLHKADPSLPENMQIHPAMFLYRGRSWTGDGGRREGVLDAHGKYMQQQKAQGKIGAAGWINTGDDLVYVVVFKYIPMMEARMLMAGDAAVQARVLRIDEHQWWLADHVLPW